MAGEILRSTRRHLSAGECGACASLRKSILVSAEVRDGDGVARAMSAKADGVTL
jgi:hypothetical protein